MRTKSPNKGIPFLPNNWYQRIYMIPYLHLIQRRKMFYFFRQTLIPKSSESSSALDCLKVFPAFVTKTTGRRNFPDSSVNSRKASFAEGRIRFPRLMTPSMSNKNPKSCPLFDCKVLKEIHLYVNIPEQYTWIYMDDLGYRFSCCKFTPCALTGKIVH